MTIQHICTYTLEKVFCEAVLATGIQDVSRFVARHFSQSHKRSLKSVNLVTKYLNWHHGVSTSPAQKLRLNRVIVVRLQFDAIKRKKVSNKHHFSFFSSRRQITCRGTHEKRIIFQD